MDKQILIGIKKGLSLGALFLLLTVFSQAQPIYNMTNALVDDCKGTLLSSGQGTLPGHYDHNENYTFTICVPGAKSITMSFQAFCTEAPYDSLRLFDGPNIGSPQIGPAYSGTGIPPSVTTTGSCLTVNFISDANVTCTGWVATWRADIEEPDLPVLQLAGLNPPCSTNTLTVNFSLPIHCDSVTAGAFTIAGASGNSVTAATPLNCNNDSTTSAQITFGPGLNESGFYTVTYTSFYKDPCDSIWTLIAADTFAVIDCPLRVELTAVPDTICAGDCAQLTAYPAGGAFLTYQYAWSAGLPGGPGPHTVCPTVTTTYGVTLSDGRGSTPATDSVTVVVLPQPNMPPPIGLCETDPPFALQASPLGGTWSGPGITDPQAGTFDPSIAGGGIHNIQYTGPNGCAGTVAINVSAIDAGGPVAACPGSGQFQMPLATPLGGVWSGSIISPGGTVTPPAAIGIYHVAYTANTCVDSATVYIDTITLSPIDTVCESQRAFNLNFWPPGGFWQGTGITDPYDGTFDPGQAGTGSYTLTYYIFGCNKSFDIYVKAITVGNSLYACPMQAPFTLATPSPPGGIWSGPGILDSLLGVFDPGVNGGNFTANLVYTVDGCSATQVVRVRQTDITNDSLEFCPTDPLFKLSFANTGRTPPNGLWSGPGVTDPDNPGDFTPTVAGPGVHTLTYIANTCTATMTMIVHPPPLPADTSVCEGTPPFNISSLAPGGIWAGPGIIDTLTGTFSATAAGLGIHKIYYLAPTLCLDSMEIQVYQPVTPTISNLAPVYCYRDTSIQLVPVPAGGVFSGPGVSGYTFNPSIAGPGQHQLTYKIGEGPCERSVTRIVNIGPPMDVRVAFARDTICFGDFTTLSATASGGSTGNFTYTWSPDNLKGPSVPVSPSATTTYTVTVTDGCTEPVRDEVTIQVSPEFTLRFEGSGPVCFGDSGYATAVVTGTSTYLYEWNTTPPVYSPTLRTTTGFNYQVTITDAISGCLISGTTEIVSYPFVRAFFSANPNGDCVSMFEPTFNFLDQSTGGTTGKWTFGDSVVAEYIPGVNPVHSYTQVGTYPVTLILENEGGCRDSFSVEVCVIPEKSGIHIPNAFTPNNDGFNDQFLIQGIGILEYELTIFDRWGNLIFLAENIADSWDGTYKGQPVPEGVYVYLIKGAIRDNNEFNNYASVKLFERGTVTVIR